MTPWPIGAEAGVTRDDWIEMRAMVVDLQRRLDRAKGRSHGRWQAALELWEPTDETHIAFAWWRWQRALGLVYVSAAGFLFVAGAFMTALIFAAIYVWGMISR